MDFQELKRFIDTEDARIHTKQGSYPDEEKRILARTVKLGEEYGELCNDILGYLSLQRDEKRGGYDAQNLRGEFADVLITTLLLAKSVDVDIEKALREKIEKINRRYEE